MSPLSIPGKMTLQKQYSTVVSDPDATTYLQAVEAADGQTLEIGVAQAVNDFVVGCKANGIWTSATQLLMPCGPRTLTGALIPLKGTSPTNNGFLTGDYNRKTGLGDPSNTSKWLNSNILQNSLPQFSHALAWRGSIVVNSGNQSLIGRYNNITNSSSSLLALDSWADTITPSGRAFRSGTWWTGQYPISTSTAAASCLIGSRTAINAASLYVDNNTPVTNTNYVSSSFEAQSLGWFAMNLQAGAPGAFSTDRLQVGGIYTSGLDSTQAAVFRTLTETYVNDIGAAIP